jgi:TPR repeat protein
MAKIGARPYSPRMSLTLLNLPRSILVLLTSLASFLSMAQSPASDKPSLAEVARKAEQGEAEAQYRIGRIYARADGVPRDKAQAARWLRKAAEQGDARAMYALGSMLVPTEKVMEQDPESGFWFRASAEPLRKAAEQGDAEAQVFLGDAYLFGRGVSQDAEEAYKWIRRAAEQGNNEAQYRLGSMFKSGEGLLKDEAEASRWFRMAAEQYRNAAEKGDVVAQRVLSAMYRSGEGVPKDEAEAVRWFRIAFDPLFASAEQGNVAAQRTLGEYYRYRDTVEAAKWYRQAAGQGDVEAQRMLGELYRFRDDVEAAKWYRKAAEQRDMNSQGALGLMFELGEGVSKDDAEAARWYRMVEDQENLNLVNRYRYWAEKGDAQAQYKLGDILFVGKIGPGDEAEGYRFIRKAADQGHAEAQFGLGIGIGSQDHADRFKWLQRAADQGHAVAQGFIGVYYESGSAIVARDFVVAYKWYNLAASSGDKRGIESRANLEKKMTPQQIAKAQELTSDFTPRQWKASSQKDDETIVAAQIVVSGSGFFVTTDGFFVTNHHVVVEAKRVRVRTAGGTFDASVVQVDPTNDLAVLKVVRADGEFVPLAVCGSRGLKLADRVATLGYPNPDLQGQAAKYSSGEIGALSGPGDDPRFLQISVPIQPGNSGGPLVNSAGCVVGVIVAQLDKIAALKTTGSLPENVNYAVKGTILLGVLEAVPGLADGLLAEPAKSSSEPTDVAKMVERACGMVLVEK